MQDPSDPTKQVIWDLSGITSGQTRTITMPDSNVTLGSGGGSSPPFTDSDPLIKGSSDISKLLKFEVDGFTTATTRTITIPNSSTTMAGLSVLSQTWTGTNIFAGITTVIDSNFGIKDFSDNTKVINFDASLISSSTTRTYSLPNTTTTLAGLGVVSQSWTGTNNYFGVTNFNGNVTLGNSASDSVTFIADTIGDITANVDNTDDIGTSSRTYANAWVKSSLGIVEGYATGFKPSGVTNAVRLFTVPTGAGKTELRASFQTGGSVIIVTEP